MRWRRTLSMEDASPLQKELAQQEALVCRVREDLYSITPRFRRSMATTALAASVAERAYRISDGLPELQNATSQQWRQNLNLVWHRLAGDEEQHYALSAAVAEYLTSPLNHNEGQDGRDDMDRPQTVAALAAVMSAIEWAVDFAETAINGLFEAVDLKYDQQMLPARSEEVDRLAREIAQDSQSLRDALHSGRTLPPALLTALRG